jgi:DNA polymerase-4
VKLRDGDFAPVTRARTLGAPTDDAQAIWSVAERLVADALTERPGPVRLLGVGVSGLVGAGQLRLFPAAASAPALSGSAEPGSDER